MVVVALILLFMSVLHGCPVLIRDASRLIIKTFSNVVVEASWAAFLVLLPHSFFIAEFLLPTIAARLSTIIIIFTLAGVVVHHCLEDERNAHNHGDLTKKSATTRASGILLLLSIVSVVLSVLGGLRSGIFDLLSFLLTDTILIGCISF